MIRKTILLAALFVQAAIANWDDTPTGIDLDKLPRFPLTKLRSTRVEPGGRARFDGIEVASETREFTLRGASKSGVKWTAHLCCLEEVWRGDLDGNGTQDYVLSNGGPYFNGRTTPLYSLTILLMDPDGLPVPFFTTVYKGENGSGIKHLVDLDRDGHAGLLIGDYSETAICAGWWTTQRYRFTNLRAEEVRGPAGGIVFPFVHKWEDRRCGKPAATIPQPPRVEHGTSGTTQVTARILDEHGGVLSIRPIGGCREVSPQVIVDDRPVGREIGLPNAWTPYTADLARRILHSGAEVRLAGLSNPEAGHCFANLMWAAR